MPPAATNVTLVIRTIDAAAALVEVAVDEATTVNGRVNGRVVVAGTTAPNTPEAQIRQGSSGIIVLEYTVNTVVEFEGAKSNTVDTVVEFKQAKSTNDQDEALNKLGTPFKLLIISK